MMDRSFRTTIDIEFALDHFGEGNFDVVVLLFGVILDSFHVQGDLIGESGAVGPSTWYSARLEAERTFAERLSGALRLLA